MQTSVQIRDWLKTWLAGNGGSAWPSESELLNDLDGIVAQFSLGLPGRWRVEHSTQAVSDPGEEPYAHQPVYSVTKGGGGVYTTPIEARATAIEGALNALEANLNQESGG